MRRCLTMSRLGSTAVRNGEVSARYARMVVASRVAVQDRFARKRRTSSFCPLHAARDEILTAIGGRELAITSAHALAAADLPALHRDPFDRVLIAQTIVEGLVLVTADEAVRQYDVPAADADAPSEFCPVRDLARREHPAPLPNPSLASARARPAVPFFCAGRPKSSRTAVNRFLLEELLGSQQRRTTPLRK